jgi:hypothetical protein
MKKASNLPTPTVTSASLPSLTLAQQLSSIITIDLAWEGTTPLVFGQKCAIFINGMDGQLATGLMEQQHTHGAFTGGCG